MLSLLLILYGEDDTYGESRYDAESRTNRYSRDRFGVDALLYDTDAGTDRYGAVQVGDNAVYADSNSEYEQQRTDNADVVTGYSFLDLSVPYQGMYEPSYRIFAP